MQSADLICQQSHKEFISELYRKMEEKSYIIDPLTLLCKLALLSFMPEGTKLRISNHILHIQEVGYMQGAIRMIHGDTRRDISYMNMPLIKAIKWYIIKGDDRIIPSDDSLLEELRTISYFAIKGLQKIQSSTYNDDIGIKIIIQYFINLLSNAMNNTWSEDEIVKNNSSDTLGSIIADTIKYNYDPNTIKSISKMLSDADQKGTSSHNVNALTECIHKILVNRDTEFVALMKDIHTNI